MKPASEQLKRETVLTCRINGVEVSIEELAKEINRCGGVTRKGAK